MYTSDIFRFFIIILILVVYVQSDDSFTADSQAKDYISTHSQTSSNRSFRLTITTEQVAREAFSEEYNHLVNDFNNFNYKTESQADIIRNVLLARLQSAIFNDKFIHHYGSIEAIELARGPEVDHDLCLNQLRHLNERMSAFGNERWRSTDYDSMRIMDVFGKMSSHTLQGELLYLGDYRTCINSSFNFTQGRQSMRYCIAGVKHADWRRLNALEEIAELGFGVCLPSTCDSSGHKDKGELVERLVKLAQPGLKDPDWFVSSLYCLPDNKSTMRQWWRSPGTNLICTFTALWILLLICGTLKYKSHDKDHSGFESSSNNLCKAISISENLKSLFDLSQPEMTEVSNGRNDTKSDQVTLSLVDFTPLEGIKVLSCCYIIMGHVLMAHVTIARNMKELAAGSIAYYTAYIMPAFAVNVFFVITGMLTSYYMFKQNQTKITSPNMWLKLIVYRYLRLMPIYLILVLFAKHVVKHLGDGPFWDYGTSTLSPRYKCQNESLLWTLLLGSNFKSPFDHCIASAWSLADDFQFLLVTPIFLTVLYKSPDLGRWFVKTCMVAGFVSNFYSNYQAEIDTRPIANFQLHGFSKLITFVMGPYTWPQCRIPAYLLGLLYGHTLYLVERKRAMKINDMDQFDSFSQVQQSKVGSLWSKSFILYQPILTALVLIVNIFQPSILHDIPFTEWGAKVGVAFLLPANHLLFAWAAGSYLLLATTGYGCKCINAFFAHPLWKPLAKLGLCAVLINLEVIQHFVQSKTQFEDFTNQSQLSFTIFSIISTYLLSAVLYIVFEAPITNLIKVNLRVPANKKKKIE